MVPPLTHWVVVPPVSGGVSASGGDHHLHHGGDRHHHVGDHHHHVGDRHHHVGDRHHHGHRVPVVVMVVWCPETCPVVGTARDRPGGLRRARMAPR